MKKRKKNIWHSSDTVVSFPDFQQPWVPSVTLIANFVGVIMGVFIFGSENKIFLKHTSLKIWCLVHSFKRIVTSGHVCLTLPISCFFLKALSETHQLCVQHAWGEWLWKQPDQSEANMCLQTRGSEGGYLLGFDPFVSFITCSLEGSSEKLCVFSEVEAINHLKTKRWTYTGDSWTNRRDAKFRFRFFLRVYYLKRQVFCY